MLTRRIGKRRFRLRRNDLSGFLPRAARAAIQRPRRLARLAREEQSPHVSDLRRRAPAKTIERVAEARLPTEYGEFRIIGYRSLTSDEEFIALARGELRGSRPTLARIHSTCHTGGG